MTDLNHTLRNSGLVKRYHARLTHRQQNVAEHTWQLMRIYHQMWTGLPERVAIYILYHDVAEVHTGDTPYHVKRDYPKVKEGLKEAEADVLLKFRVTSPMISEEEHRRIKQSEYCEMFEYALEERALGSRYCDDVISNMLRVIDRDDRYVNAYMFTESELICEYLTKGPPV